MGANGDQDPPLLQRVFWALIEGATATALLVAGGSDSLTALQVIRGNSRSISTYLEFQLDTFYDLKEVRS